MWPFIAGLVLTALLTLIGHWFPWPVKLHRLAAYAYGCLAILSGTAIWLLSMRRGTTLLAFAAFIVVAGVSTGLGYGVDAVLRARVARQVQDERGHEHGS